MKNLSLILAVVCLCAQPFWAQKETNRLSGQDAQALLSRQPVLFLENCGQLTDVKGALVPSVFFKTAAGGIETYITSEGLVYVFSKPRDPSPEERFSLKDFSMEWVRVHLEGATILKENIVKASPSETVQRYFLRHASQEILAKSYETITVKEVYPGIDWILYGSSETGMKYDFIVHPGADPNNIRLIYEGDQPLSIDAGGNIHVKARFGTITEHAPVSFTRDAHTRVQSAFESKKIDSHNVRITYRLGDYPKDETLVIDPQLTWGTYVGTSGPEVLAATAHDSNNNLFIAGYTWMTDFPLLDAGTYFQGTAPASTNAVIMKFGSNGVLLWSTYYGGSSIDNALSITCDANDNVFVGGLTSSDDFPTFDAGTYYNSVPDATDFGDMFLLKFDNAGNRLWATLYTGMYRDQASALACDAAGNLFVAGYTGSFDFPILNGGGYFQSWSAITDIVLLKFDNTGNLLNATCYGGNGDDVPSSIVVNNNGDVYIAGYTASTDFPLMNAGTWFQGAATGGEDGFILKFDNNGTRLWATYCGGNADEEILGIACDAENNLFTTGLTWSADFPVMSAGTYFDGTHSWFTDRFIQKFDSGGNLLWSTYYGGSAMEGWYSDNLTSGDISVDACGMIYVSLVTYSNDISLLDAGNGSYFDPVINGGVFDEDIVLLKFSNDGTLLWGTYLGGESYEKFPLLEVDNNNQVFVVGVWGIYPSNGDLLLDPGNGAYFDATYNSPNQDCFIWKFSPDPVTHTVSQTEAGCNCSGTATVSVSGATPPYNYTWSNGVQTLNSASPTNTVTGVCPGPLWVEITSCGNTDTVHFDFQPGIPPIVQLTAEDTTICPGTAIGFSVMPADAASYSWTFGDGQTSTNGNPVISFANPGNYNVSVTVTNADGCTATRTRANYIDVFPKPSAAFSASSYETSLSFPVIAFTELATGENNWQWSFGDPYNGQSPLQNPSYNFPAAGRFTTQLIVSNEFGCTDTASALIQVYDDFAFYAPNSFTPNGDQSNNTWFPQGAGIDEERFGLQIFNRWGEPVWETKSWGESWDGANATEGVYTWVATVTTTRGLTMQYNGHITLIR